MSPDKLMKLYMARVHRLLATLREQSEQIAGSPCERQPVSESAHEAAGVKIHPVVLAVLANGDLGTERAEIGVGCLALTSEAHGEGIAKKYDVIGRQPDGHCWFVTERRTDPSPGIIDVDRLSHDLRTRMTLPQWLEQQVVATSVMSPFSLPR